MVERSGCFPEVKERISQTPLRNLHFQPSPKARLGVHLSASARNSTQGIWGRGESSMFCVWECFPKCEVDFAAVLFHNFFVNPPVIGGGYVTAKENVKEAPEGGLGEAHWPRWQMARFELCSIELALVFGYLRDTRSHAGYVKRF